MANATYPDLTKTKFPNEIDNFDRFIDPTPEDQPIINQYYAYQTANNWIGMKNILDNNPTLSQKMIGAEQLNRMLEAIIAIERHYTSDVQSVIYSITDLTQYDGTWDKNVSYKRYSVVDYVVDEAWQCYIAKTDVPKNVYPTDLNYWKPITLRGQRGESGIGLSLKGYWNSIIEYTPEDMIVFENAWWAATRKNINKMPSKTSSDWYLLMEFDGSLMVYNNDGTDLKAKFIQGAIDELWGKLVDKVDISTDTLVNLLPDLWTGEESPYSYIISNQAITATNMIEITFRSGVTKEVTDAWDTAEIKRYTQNDGELILYADSEKPSIDIPLNMIIRGDV